MNHATINSKVATKACNNLITKEVRNRHVIDPVRFKI